MRVLTLRGCEAYRANRHTRRLMHADHMCAMLILPALPHFSEATSNVSQPSEGAARRRDLHRGRMPGESAAGDETSSRAAANGRAWQVHAQAGPYGASTGLRGLRLGWGFSQYLNWADVKV